MTMPSVICLSLSTMQPVEFPDACVICLGNFDGVHLAHRALMRTATKLRAHRFIDAVCGVFCFDPPSSEFLSTGASIKLTTLDEKLSYFRDEGMEYVFLASFPALREMSPEQFATEILRDKCHATALVCGFNHRFGHRGAGDPALLRTLLQIPVEVQNEIRMDGETVSASRIRALLQEGDVETATRLLGRHYAITSTVEHGKELGRTWGFPTVNQRFPDGMLVPRHGVYVTDCTLPDGTRRRGVTNVGVRPTVESETAVNCETHLLDFDGSLYGERVTVRFLHFLRPEKKFDTPDALRQQIAHDLERAAAYP